MIIEVQHETRFAYSAPVSESVTEVRMEPASDDPSIMLPRRQDPGPLFPWDEVVPASGLQRVVPES